MERLRKFTNLWLPVFVWAIVIFLFSTYPTTRASVIHWQDFIVKKSAHVVEYAIFSMLIYRALKESGVKKINAGLYSIALSIFYGMTDEFHQSFTPGREPRIRDVFFDATGALIAFYVFTHFIR